MNGAHTTPFDRYRDRWRWVPPIFLPFWLIDLTAELPTLEADEASEADDR